MTDIAGRAAVVTGGGSGIGMGLAKELARQGAAVAVADIMVDNARAVAAAIVAAGGMAIAIECDVCDRASIAAMRDAAQAALGPVSLVFANAGATSFDPVVEMSDDDVDWIINVNLHGVMNSARAFLPGMIAGGNGGHICATASMAGLLPGWIPVHAPYSAAKMGIIGLMMNIAMELAPHGIHTTSYCPGGVATGMKENNARYRPARFGGPGEEAVAVHDASFKDNSLRFYTPDAIAPIVLHAVSRNRPFVFDHAEHRAAFRQTYAGIVEACFDDIAAWEAEHGLPEANPTGAVLLRE